MVSKNNSTGHSPPIYPMPGEKVEQFEWFLFFAFYPRDDRTLKKVFDAYKEQNPQTTVKFHAWKTASANFNWDNRARTIDLYFVQKLAKEINPKIALQQELLSYRDKYADFFSANVKWGTEIQSIGKTLTPALLSTDGTDEDYRGKMLHYRMLTQSYQQLSAAVRSNFETWGILLGLDKLIEGFTAESNAKLHNLPEDTRLF